MADIKVVAHFILPGRVLRAETPIRKEGEKKNRKDDNLYRQEIIHIKNEKPIVINVRKGIPASQVLHLSNESYKYMISQDNPPYGTKLHDWKRLSNHKRLTLQLSIIGSAFDGKLDNFTILDD